MKTALGSGFLGACAVTAANQVAKKYIPQAPRLDELGMRAAAAVIQKTGCRPPSKSVLFGLSLAGDLISNSLFYGLVGMGRPDRAWIRGSLLGLAAGIGAVTLPEPLGLGKRPTRATTGTKATTIAWYVLGGLVAALTFSRLKRR